MVGLRVDGNCPVAIPSMSHPSDNPFTKESLVSDNIIFQMRQIRHIKNPSSFYTSNLEQQEPMKCIWLPFHEEASTLVNKHLYAIGHFHHFVHGPSLHDGVQDLYEALGSHRPVHLGEAVMLLAICASATQACVPGDPVSGLFTSTSDANVQSTAWTKATLDVIDVAEREGHTSIQCLQGMLSAMYVLCNSEGVNSRSRSLFFRCINMARELALHKIDEPDSALEVLESIRGSPVKAEIARRTWWYVVCIDWYGRPKSVRQFPD